MAQFVKLITNYYLDRAVGALTADAECLFTRAIAYCGNAETHGFVPDHAIPGLIRNPTVSRVRNICAELTNAEPDPLWLPEPGGFRLRKWDEIQSDLEELLLRRRQLDAARQQARRDRGRAGSSRDGP